MSSDLAARVAGAVPLLLVVGFLARPWPPHKRVAARDRWARRHVAHVPASWTAQVDRQLEIDRRVALAGLLVIDLSAVSFKPSLQAYAVVLVTLSGVLMLGRGLTITKAAWSLVPMPRVARSRETRLADYLPVRSRAAMWVAVLVGAAITVGAGVRQGSWILLVPGAVLLFGAVAVEVGGARLARLPEPAEDPAQLYCQDAFRADAALTAVVMSTCPAVLLTALAPTLLGVTGHLAFPVSLALAVVLLIVPGMDAVRSVRHPAAYMRSRLWPTLGPDQVLLSGDAVPRRGAVL